MIDPHDLLGQLEELRATIAELEPIAKEPYALRTLERVRRRARKIEDRLVAAGVAIHAAEVA